MQLINDYCLVISNIHFTVLLCIRVRSTLILNTFYMAVNTFRHKQNMFKS